MEFLDSSDDFVAWQNMVFPARITARRTFPAVTIPTGQSGAGLPVWLYEWKEQILDTSVTSAGYVDVDGGRVGTLSPLDCPAVEVNNIPVPDGTLVWMRLRGIQQGTQLYEFRNPAAFFGTWVRLTEFYTPDGSYSWKEVYRDSATTWADRLNGLAGIHNAREASTAQGTPGIHAHATTGTVVWLWLVYGDDLDPRWVFYHPDGFWATLGTGTDWVEWDDGSGLGGGRTSTSTGLPAVQAPGAAFTTPAGTVVWLELDRANGGYHYTGLPPVASGGVFFGEGPISTGLVSVGTQSFYGSKTVVGGVAAINHITAGQGFMAQGALPGDLSGVNCDGEWRTVGIEPIGSAATTGTTAAWGVSDAAGGSYIARFGMMLNGSGGSLVGCFQVRWDSTGLHAEFTDGVSVHDLLHPTPTIAIGTTPVTGGTTGDLLTIGSGVVSSTTIVGGAHGGLGLDLTTLASSRFLFTDGTGVVSSKAAGVTGTF